MKKRVVFGVAMVAGISGASAQLVDLDFTGEATGAATSVTNGGTLGGVFENFGGGANDPQITAATIPVPQGFPTGAPGTAGLTLDGSDFLTHTNGGGAFINAPAGIIGVDRTSSVEAWVLNPSIATEETVLSWGKRGGGEGTNASFNYGNHGTFGALGQWGAPDMGFDDAGGAPAAGEWHHIAWTFDGATTRVYSDGVLLNSEALAPGTINTHGGTPITVGSQFEGGSADQAPIFTGALRGTLTVGKVRVHDGVLSDGDVLANYNTEAGEFVAPTGPAAPELTTLRGGPVNHYTFDLNDVVGDGSAGTILKDVAGGADGTILGDGATVAGGQLDLPGGSSASAAYADLPNGLISRNASSNGGSGAVTIEVRFTNQTSQAWARIFDFGSSEGGEVMGPGDAAGGGDQGLDYLAWTAQIGTDTGNQRIEWNNREPDINAPGANRDAAAPTLGDEHHYVMTFDEATGEVVAYVDGELKTFFDGPAGSLADLNDENMWLGRSNWMGDSNTDGAYSDLKIYDYAFTRDEAFTAFQIPEPAALALLTLGGLGLIFRRRR